MFVILAFGALKVELVGFYDLLVFFLNLNLGEVLSLLFERAPIQIIHFKYE